MDVEAPSLAMTDSVVQRFLQHAVAPEWSHDRLSRARRVAHRAMFIAHARELFSQ